MIIIIHSQTSPAAGHRPFLCQSPRSHASLIHKCNRKNQQTAFLPEPQYLILAAQLCYRLGTVVPERGALTQTSNKQLYFFTFISFGNWKCFQLKLLVACVGYFFQFEILVSYKKRGIQLDVIKVTLTQQNGKAFQQLAFCLLEFSM